MAKPKRLSAFDATMLVMGGMVGVGIFFTPSSVAAHFETPALFVGAWALGALIALCGAFTFAELGASLPNNGGWFVFLREAFGRPAGFLFAWTILGVTTTAAVAVITDFAATTLLELFGAEASGRFAVAALLIIALNSLALAGLKVGASFQNFCMIAKLTAIAALLAGAIAFVTPGAGDAARILADAPIERTGSKESMWTSFAAGMLPVLFSYGGWQNVCYIAPSVRDPERVLPRAILLGTLAVGAVYVACNATFVHAIGLEELAGNGGFASALAGEALGTGFERALRAAMAVSAVGVALVTILVCPDLYVAMAQSRLFFRRFERRHARSGVPRLAVITQTALALLYLVWAHAETLFGLENDEARMNPDKLLSALVFAEWIFQGLAASALLRLRAKRPELPRPFKMPLWPLPTLLYLGAAIFVVVLNLGSAAARPELGLGVLGAGMLAFLAWRRFSPDSPG